MQKSQEGKQPQESSPVAERSKRRLKCPEDLNGLCERSSRKTAEGDKQLPWEVVIQYNATLFHFASFIQTIAHTISLT